MKLNLLVITACIFPTFANADMLYRVEQTRFPEQVSDTINDSEAFAREHRFYAGGAYNFSMWNEYTNSANVHISGKNKSSFEFMAGVRPYDIFRIEANYIRTDAEYNNLRLTGDTVMINAFFDARIDNAYRTLRKQTLVPYVGFGAGLSWNSTDDAVMDNKISPVVAALAGIGIEMGTFFTLDLGYRYFFMFSPKFDGIGDLPPMAHQFRISARVNF